MGVRLSEAISANQDVAANQHLLRQEAIFPADPVEDDEDPEVELLIQRLTAALATLPDKSGQTHRYLPILVPLEVRRGTTVTVPALAYDLRAKAALLTFV